MRRALRGLVLAAMVGLAGCDAEPGGPGSYTAVVRGPAAVGAAVVEVRGGGIDGFGPAGDSRVFGAPAAVGTIHRVVVISPTGNPLRFTISVRDLGGDRPTLTLVSATDTSNQPIASLQGYTLELTR